MYTKEQGKEIVKNLVERFKLNKNEYKKNYYNETQLRNDFINPLLQAFGWDVHNASGVSQYLREVVQEDTVDVEVNGNMTKKKPDYALCSNGQRKIFIEVKKPAVSIETALDPAFQVRRYGWSAKLPISLLINFDKLVVYDCAPKPNYRDDVRVGRIATYSFEDLVGNFDDLYNQFSADAVHSGQFDRLFPANVERKGTEQFDDYFLKQIEHWRELLATDIIKSNKHIQQKEMNFVIQKLINRIVFLRICEDRELEKYKGLLEVKDYDELKKMFIKADKRYNSGLFDFIEDDLSLNINLSDDVVIELFKELYYPESPYVFSVVESSVLSEIYELFLAKEVHILEDGSTEVHQKPEVIASDGVVTTPRFIVDKIIKENVNPLIEGKNPKELSNIKIADISCGSGVFLLAAFEYLLVYHLDWYVNNNPVSFTKEVYQESNGQWNLSLYEKHRILKNNIFGVDIDAQAIEVTRFGLLLKILENETVPAIETHLSQHGVSALPKLDTNIKIGNSLVDSSYYDFMGSGLVDEDQLIAINAFDWKEAFEDVFLNGGFDAIIGNPPYIRIQNIMKYSPLEVAYYRDSNSPYQCVTSSNFDKYTIFIERSISLLKTDGNLGVIVPNKFFTIPSGLNLRKFIAEGQYLNKVIHFGVQQIFTKKLTYTCILNLKKCINKDFIVEHVSDINHWIFNGPDSTEYYQSHEVTEEPWIFISPTLKAVFAEVKRNAASQIKDIANVFVGIQTSADPIYIVHPTSEDDEFVWFQDKNQIDRCIEKGVLRPFFHDVKFDSFGTPKANSYLILPYKEIVGRRAIPYTSEELANTFPYAWEYFLAYKEELMRRSVSPPYTKDTWHKFGRSQSLYKFNNNPKLVWTTLSTEPKYVYDDKDIIFSGGGNGPYYGLQVQDNNPHSIFYIQAVLCHPVIEAIIKTGKTSNFQGGYYSHGKQFVVDLPFKEIDFNNDHEKNSHNSIVEDVQNLINLTQRRQEETIPSTRDVIGRQIDMIKKRINSRLNILYGIDADMLKEVEGII